MQQGLQTDAICNIQKSCGCLQGALSSAFNHILSVCNLQLNQSRCLTRLPFWGFISSMCCFIACHIPDRRWRAQIGFHQISPSALLTRNLGYETIRYTHCLNYWKLGGGGGQLLLLPISPPGTANWRSFCSANSDTIREKIARHWSFPSLSLDTIPGRTSISWFTCENDTNDWRLSVTWPYEVCFTDLTHQPNFGCRWSSHFPLDENKYLHNGLLNKHNAFK